MKKIHQLSLSIPNLHPCKLKDSGYSAKFRAEIIKSAKNAFNLQIQNDSKGIRPLFRDKNRIIQDQKEKGVGSVDWWNKAYYKDPKNKKYSTILFVPPTPGGKLAKQMQKREAELNANSNTRIKVVETGGSKLKHILVQNNPNSTLPCQKQFCPFCKETMVSVPAVNSAELDSAKLSCRTPSVGYTVSCMECKKNGTPAVYIGETGRTAVTRGEEHIRAILKKNPQNPMSKHLSRAHPNQKHVKFEFGLTQHFRDPLSRQADEALRIASSSKQLVVLNSKSEFNKAPIARVQIGN